MYHDVTMAGFGGQGVLLIGNLLAYAGMKQGLNVSYMPAYGVEMRGGTANCTVVVSDEEIGSPVVEHPQAEILLNDLSWKRFGGQLQAGSLLILNTDLVEESQTRVEGLRRILLPCNELSMKAGGNDRFVNMIALGAYLETVQPVTLGSIEAALKDVLPERHHKLIPANVQALQTGMDHARAAMAAG